MPDELEDELEELVLGAAPPELDEDVAGEDDVVLEFEEFEPQADTASAPTASRQAVLQRIERLLAMNMNGSLVTAKELVSRQDAGHEAFVPGDAPAPHGIAWTRAEKSRPNGKKSRYPAS